MVAATGFVKPSDSLSSSTHILHRSCNSHSYVVCCILSLRTDIYRSTRLDSPNKKHAPSIAQPSNSL